MATYESFKRLELLLGILKRRPNSSKKQLIEYLAERHEIYTTARTLERDFKSLKDEFQIVVLYNRAENGYVIDDENHKRVQSLLKFVELIHVGEIFKEGLADFDSLRDIIDLDDSAAFKGIDQLRAILLAVRKKQKITFEHENYTHDTDKNYTITPFRILEYLNRWYVIGVPEGENEIRTFGIDRITQLKIEVVSLLKRKDFESQLEQFLHIVGVSYYSVVDTPVTVVLKVQEQQLKYLRSLPLHRTQRIEHKEQEAFGLVYYTIIPNYEFELEILKLNHTTTVLEPKWLRENIKEKLRKSLDNY